MIPYESFAQNGLREALLKTPVILRLPEVLAMRGLSRSTHYLQIQDGLFTKPVSLGFRAVGWPGYEVAALNAARIAGKSDTEIRALVCELEALRNSSAK